MAELRVKSTGTLKLFENDNTSSVTIASPASLGGDRTITLPDASVTLASGTMLATDGSGASLTALNASELGSGTVPAARLSGVGKVLQVLSASVGNVTTTTTSFADTGLTVDITPAATSSKVLVLVNMVGLSKGAQLSSINMVLVRDSTDILEFEALAGYTASTDENAVGGTGGTYLDSPSTTSATTYKVQWALAAGTTSYQIGAWYSGSIRPLSTITVMEIGV